MALVFVLVQEVRIIEAKVGAGGTIFGHYTAALNRYVEVLEERARCLRYVVCPAPDGILHIFFEKVSASEGDTRPCRSIVDPFTSAPCKIAAVGIGRIMASRSGRDKRRLKMRRGMTL